MTLQSFVLWLCSHLTPSKTYHISSGFSVSYSKRVKAFSFPPSCCCTKGSSRTDPSDKTEIDRFVSKILTMRWKNGKQYWKLCAMRARKCRDLQWCFQCFNVVWEELPNFRNSPEQCYLPGSLREISAHQQHHPRDMGVKSLFSTTWYHFDSTWIWNLCCQWGEFTENSCAQDHVSTQTIRF